MKARPAARSAVIAVALVFGMTGCATLRGDPEIGTGRRFRALAQHLDSLQAPLPERLEDLCARGLSCGVSDTALEFQDGWKRRLAYTPGANSYELRSSGVDAVLGSPDDLVFTPQLERQWRDRLAGCFRLLSAAAHIPRELRLETAEAGYRIYRVTPEAGWSAAAWWPLSETVAILVRQDSYHNPTTLRLRIEGDSVSVVQTSRPPGIIRAERAPCPGGP